MMNWPYHSIAFFSPHTTPNVSCTPNINCSFLSNSTTADPSQEYNDVADGALNLQKARYIPFAATENDTRDLLQLY